MENIHWGIIGCGDVTEIKSGPAFSKINNSRLVAVMRRDAVKAKDYAKRHQVLKWYSDAGLLINDREINAVYIATPPDTHHQFTLAALAANKFVYVEKPMALNYFEAKNMAEIATQKKGKLVIAHYRREQPLFKKIKQLLQDKIIGEIKLIQLQYIKKALTVAALQENRNRWRINPEVSGGGLFYDIAPHQLDLIYHFFGEAEIVSGISKNQGGFYNAADTVSGQILFKNGAVFTGLWSFGIADILEKDTCEIIGTQGKICFSIFNGHTITLTKNNKTEVFNFEVLQHVQQPMIEKVVAYFIGLSENPCNGNEGALIMQWMEKMTAKNY